ncbi:urokinase plasminogen activator surface receptor-like [Dendropsophus ebraccatus]|uniref:urokinase plasminogen activator surface receptor-like n=1 Tax=Dendropsophus ebraccatus TaxID=150705 RepID=UPI0038318929
MGSSLLLLCVISAITSTSYSLSCIQCSDASDVPCTGSEQTCSLPHEVCVSRYALTLVAGVPISKLFIRGCGDPDQCTISGSMSVPNVRTIASATCCSTDLCTPPPPELPPVTSDQNGVVCKSCQAMEDSPCDSDNYMNCVGNETMCISQVTITGSSSIAVRGCATPGLCQIPHEEGTFGHMTFISDTTCTDGGAGLHYGLYLLGVTLLCVFKVVP